ncbi:hypothetical protein [Roseateles depolymerans]|uniref:Uncharacterized protein n=1 Tax=Roseateles depolymerans TaxID=76731 RepID=A0A0U2TZU8_9BURK|nr:hypothetical protein [Roseateles depolymerans]ALV05665.1 hypothetical protein RD2015_1173 [Roseateles depolymerans]REG13072.1 hypothetical protein DES44_4450 [Roseateles depolymerans]
MSISMFFVSPQTPEEKKFNLPVCTEDVFKRVVLPAAERVGAQYVQLFETGIEILADDTSAISEELRCVANQIEADASDATLYILPRLKNLQWELERIFNYCPEAVLYIG